MIVKIYISNNDSASHNIVWYTEGTSYYSFVITSVGVLAGTSGTSGTSGVNGSSGTSGTSGTSGSSGTTGSSGTSGTAGTSGTSPVFDSGSYATTGSNTFIGNQTITGSVAISPNNKITVGELEIGSVYRGAQIFADTSGNTVAFNMYGSGSGDVHIGAVQSDFSSVIDLGISTNHTDGITFANIGPDFNYYPFLNIPTGSGSGSTINFVRPINVSGSLNVSGSEFVIGTVQASDANVGPQYYAPTVFQGVGTTAVAYDQFVNGGNYDALHIQSDLNSGSIFQDYNQSGLSTWLKIPTNPGTDPAPQFTRGLDITGSLYVSASAYVGSGSDNDDTFVGVTATQNPVASFFTIKNPSYPQLYMAAVDNPDYTYDNEFNVIVSSGSIEFKEYNQNRDYNFRTWLKVDASAAGGSGIKPVQFLRNTNITGSLNVTSGITGSLQGTASYAVTASYALNGGGGGGDRNGLITTGSLDAFQSITGSLTIDNTGGTNDITKFEVATPDFSANFNGFAVQGSNFSSNQVIGQYLFSSGLTQFNMGVYDGSNDVELYVTTTTGQTLFQDWNNGSFNYNTWLAIPANNGSNPLPQFKRGLATTGSISILSGSLLLADSSGSVRIADNFNRLALYKDENTSKIIVASNCNMDQVNTQFGVVSGSTNLTVIGGNTLPFRTGSNNLFVGAISSLVSGSYNTFIGTSPQFATGSNNVIIGGISNTITGATNDLLSIGTTNYPSVISKNDYNPLIINSNTTISGSLNISGGTRNKVISGSFSSGTGSLDLSLGNSFYFNTTGSNGQTFYFQATNLPSDLSYTQNQIVIILENQGTGTKSYQYDPTIKATSDSNLRSTVAGNLAIVYNAYAIKGSVIICDYAELTSPL